jgi:hypothetical protein
MKTKLTETSISGTEPEQIQIAAEALQKYSKFHVNKTTTTFIYFEKRIAVLDLYEAFRRIKKQAKENDVVILQRDKSNRASSVRYNDVKIEIKK